MNCTKNTFFLFSILLCIIGIFSACVYLIIRISSTADKVIYTDSGDSTTTLLTTITELAEKPDMTTLSGFEDGRINILLLGIAGTEKQGAHLTDTIIVASIDTIQKKVALLSLPRDLLVSTTEGSLKINSLYEVGRVRDRHTDLIRKAVTHVTGLPINYDLVMDFAGFEQIVDVLGGINVTVPREIYDDRYPGPGYSYETFHITEGFHVLDGTTALKYARTRYEDPESDFGRARRQQVILSALRNKAFSRELLKPQTILSLLTTLEDHIRTDITPREIRGFLSLIKDVDTQNITNVVIDAWKLESLLVSINKKYGNAVTSGLSPRTGNWSETRRTATEIFARESRAQRQSEITAEESVLHIHLPKNTDPVVKKRIQALLTDTGFGYISFVQDISDTQNTTTVYDHSEGTRPFSLDEIIKRLSAQITNQNSLKNIESEDRSDSRQSTFTISIGTNLIKNLSYEEISKDALTQKEESSIAIPK